MLSDRDLYNLALTDNIVSPFDLENCEGPTVNLRLDPVVRKYISDAPIILGREVTEKDYLDIDLSEETFSLLPGDSILVQTVETVKVPNHLSGVIYERYSVKTLGLEISPAHYLNPGYRGKVGLVAVNHSPVPIQLVPGVRICQLAFFELSSEPNKPYEKQTGKYMDSNSASISKLHLDKEIQEFLQRKGVSNVSDGMAKELGEYLMGHVRESAKRLADTIRKEEGLARE